MTGLADTATTTPCPACGYEFLSIETRLVAKTTPYSLAGVQNKVAAYEWPYIVCKGCGISAPGKT